MQVRFNEIFRDGLRFEINDESWFPDQEISRSDKVHASAFLNRNGRRVIFEGSFNTELNFNCDRCLEPFTYPMDINFRIEFELVDKSLAAEPIADHLCSVSEMDMVYLDEPVIDVFQVFRQQVFLALPMKNICSEECKGLCGKCGANLNLGKCYCSKKNVSLPFSVLGRLKN